MKNRQTRIPRSRLRSSYFTTIMSMALVLFMLSLLGFLILNARNLADQVKENIGFSVILKENVKEADIIQVQKYFDASPAVKETAYIPPEKAAEELQKTLGEDFIDFLGHKMKHFARIDIVSGFYTIPPVPFDILCG